MKRALRVDKLTIAALSAVLRLYADPERVAQRLPTLRLLTRPLSEIEALARDLQPVVAACVEAVADVEITPFASQIGSGAMPVDSLPSMGLTLRPKRTGRRRRGAAERLSDAFRRLPVPVIGRVRNDTFQLDLRCLDDLPAFRHQLSLLDQT
jgi:L-seryl-tRNA(Ser) seleniumtransferase